MLVYGASVWQPIDWQFLRNDSGEQHVLKGPTAQLAKIQNRCLQIVVGVYKATSVSVLKTETYTSPLDLHIAANIAKFHLRHKQSGMEKLVSQACAKICGKLQKHHISRCTERECWTEWAET